MRININGESIRLDEWDEIITDQKVQDGLEFTRNTTVDLVIDRLLVSKVDQKRLAEAIENAFHRGHGLVKICMTDKNGETEILSETPANVESGFFQLEELTPRMFSFNSHVGACPACDGLGVFSDTNEALCSDCDGERLKSEFRSVTINDLNISKFCQLSIAEARTKIENWIFTENQHTIAEQALGEIITRLKFMEDVGLDYLTLDQKTSTLS